MQPLRHFAGDYLNNQHEEFWDLMPRLARANLSKIFTAPGTSNANLQQRRNRKAAGGAMDLYEGYAPWLKSMQPMMLQGYENLFNLGSQSNVNAMLEAMHRHALMNALMANRSAMNMFGNQSLAQGMGINAMNKGIDAGNAYMGEQYDPAMLMNRMAAGLNAMQMPLQDMQSLASTIYGQPQVPVGKSGLDVLGQAAGLAQGFGWNPFARAAPGNKRSR
jgi:hypothetical protein